MVDPRAMSPRCGAAIACPVQCRVPLPKSSQTKSNPDEFCRSVGGLSAWPCFVLHDQSLAVPTTRCRRRHRAWLLWGCGGLARYIIPGYRRRRHLLPCCVAIRGLPSTLLCLKPSRGHWKAQLLISIPDSIFFDFRGAETMSNAAQQVVRRAQLYGRSIVFVCDSMQSLEQLRQTVVWL